MRKFSLTPAVLLLSMAAVFAGGCQGMSEKEIQAEQMKVRQTELVNAVKMGNVFGLGDACRVKQRTGIIYKVVACVCVVNKTILEHRRWVFLRPIIFKIEKHKRRAHIKLILGGDIGL